MTFTESGPTRRDSRVFLARVPQRAVNQLYNSIERYGYCSYVVTLVS